MGVLKGTSSIAQRRDFALALVFRRPSEGHGKRRLAASIGEALALEVCHFMLQCALEDIRAWQGPVVLAPEHTDDLAWARQLLLSHPQAGSKAKLVVQGHGNLGVRLQRLDRALKGMRFGRRIYIGSDAPALGLRHYRRVLRGLRTHDVVLADARDGGVTMMATGKGWPGLAALPWGAPGLADALSAACRKAGRTVLRYPGGFDVDRVEDLRRLHRALEGDPRPARRQLLQLLTENGLG